ncbi:MAG TPA: tape measure protein [Mycobacterium sp.]|nr:tape measure protein [Mycobacterium sp.]
MSPELKRQADILERIQGPMREYEATLAALDMLLAKEQIDLADYNRELERAQKLAGSGLGPVQGPVQQKPGANPTDQTATVTSALTAYAAGGGIVALGHQLDDLVEEMHRYEDAAIKAENSVRRFVDTSHTLNGVLDQQLEFAERIHAPLEATIQIYGRMHEAADSLGLSSSEVAKETTAFAQAAQLGGQSAESAEGLIRRWSIAMATGTVETRSMRQIMNQMPAITDLWTKSLGVTQGELLKMVKDGRVSVETLNNAILNGADQIGVKFEEIQKSNAQRLEEFTTKAEIYAKRYGLSMGEAMLATPLIQGAGTMNEEQLTKMASFGFGPAVAALEQLKDKHREQANEFIEDLTHLTGAFRPVGDAIREYLGIPTQAVQQEIDKINAPIERARIELANLEKAYQTGKIAVQDYEAEHAKLVEVLQRGLPDIAHSLNKPIADAKAQLAQLTVQWAAGMLPSVEAYNKEYEKLKTQENGGRTPEDLKLTAPIAQAKIELSELIEKNKEGRISAEEFRKEYDSLVTTINDGRLPDAIKLWEQFTNPFKEMKLQIGGLDALFQRGAVDAERYAVEFERISKAAEDTVPHLSSVYARAVQLAQLAGNLGPKTKGGVGLSISVENPEDTAKFFESQGYFEKGSAAYATAAAKSSAAILQAYGELQQPLDFAQQAQEKLDAEARDLGTKYVTPLEQYQRQLEVITRATQIAGLTEQEATGERRRAREELDKQTEALEAQKGPLEQYEAALRKINDQLAEHAISQRKASDEMIKARIAYLQAADEGKTFAGAFQLQMLQLEQQTKDFGASVAKLAVDDIGKLSDAFVDAANGGKVSFSDMAESMLADLEKIAARALEVRAIAALLPSGGGGGSSGATGGDASALGDLLGIGSTIAGLAGHANGGQWTVGGSGSGDTQLQMFRATPGETVTVTPVGRAPMQASGTPPVIHIHNHYDQATMTAAIDSRAGRQVVLNQLRANQAATRSFLGIRR